jgi:hypothetical protein
LEPILGSDDFPWANGDLNVMLRSFIFQTVVNASDGIIPNIKLMRACERYVVTGKVPAESKGKHLKVVDE